MFGYFFSWTSLGQVDTVMLESVTVAGFPWEEYATSGAIQAISTSEQSLASALSSETNIYFKTYGNQQLATISFRGTSASHTNVSWHGIPVNSPTLGQTDFSIWPVWLMDDIAVEAGSSGAKFGSGAIGGSVFIDHFNHSTEGFSLQLRGGIGSFGENFQGVSAAYGNGQFSGATKVFRNAINNNFSYPLKGTDEIQTQNNASVLSYGAKQRLQWQTKKHRLSTDFMLTRMDREVQPTITNNNGTDQTWQDNTRLAVEHLWDLPIGTLTTTGGWINDQMTYNSNAPIISNQWSLTQQVRHDPNNKWSLSGGYLFNHSTANSDNFDERANQSYLDLFANSKWRFGQSWIGIVSLRQSFFDNGQKPFSPSISIERNWKSAFTLSATASRGFRYPTLNDRFWNPGGNPDIRSESSLSYELASTYQSKHWKVTVEPYFIHAKDWILWSPTSAGFWSPDNLQEVQIMGVEGVISYARQWESIEFVSDLRGQIQQSINKSDYPSESALDKQLPYVPKITANWQNTLTVRSWSLGLNQSFTGLRYTTLDNTDFQSVDGFYLLDILARWEPDIALHPQLEFRINNVFDTYYENLKNRAMPGINYSLQITFNIQNQ